MFFSYSVLQNWMRKTVFVIYRCEILTYHKERLKLAYSSILNQFFILKFCNQMLSEIFFNKAYNPLLVLLRNHFRLIKPGDIAP